MARLASSPSNECGPFRESGPFVDLDAKAGFVVVGSYPGESGGVIPCEREARAVGTPELRYIDLPVQQSLHRHQRHPGDATTQCSCPAAPINPPVAKLIVTDVPRFATTPADPAAIQRRRRRRNWSP